MVLRGTKGVKLTHAEVDANFQELLDANTASNTDILTNTNDITAIETAAGLLATEVGVNTTDIGTNAINIAANTAAISGMSTPTISVYETTSLTTNLLGIPIDFTNLIGDDYRMLELTFTIQSHDSKSFVFAQDVIVADLYVNTADIQASPTPLRINWESGAKTYIYLIATLDSGDAGASGDLHMAFETGGAYSVQKIRVAIEDKGIKTIDTTSIVTSA